MKIRASSVGLIVLVLAAALSCGAWIQANRRNDEMTARYGRQLANHRDFCTKVANSMHNLQRTFLGNDTKAQEEARRNFYDSTVAFHNASSIVLCLNPDHDARYPLECFLSSDYGCLGKSAQQFEAGIRSYMANLL